MNLDSPYPLLLGSLLGGLAFFAWSAVSWMALPWHRRVYRTFTDEDAVARVLVANAPVSGIYGLPEQMNVPSGAGAEQRQAAETALWEKMQRGPIVTAVVTREGFGSLPRMLAVSVATAVLLAFGFGLLLSCTRDLSYPQRVLLLGAVGLIAGIACRIPDWNWHKFPLAHAAVNIADLTVGSLLAGLVVAWFVGAAPVR